MKITTYTIDNGRITFSTTDADVAQFQSKMGSRVTASTADPSDLSEPQVVVA